MIRDNEIIAVIANLGINKPIFVFDYDSDLTLKSILTEFGTQVCRYKLSFEVVICEIALIFSKWRSFKQYF